MSTVTSDITVLTKENETVGNGLKIKMAHLVQAKSCAPGGAPTELGLTCSMHEKMVSINTFQSPTSTHMLDVYASVFERVQR